MRIVSLLPSLTELVCKLGRGDELVGVTHECDYPEFVSTLPRLTRSRIDAKLSSLQIDSLVAEQGGSLYELDEELLRELEPDIVLTQAQCDVCAVNEAKTREIAELLPRKPMVESFAPVNLAGVHAMFRKVGELIDRREQAERLASEFQNVAAKFARECPAHQLTIVHIEWIDPPFCSGHWNPEILKFAGATELVGAAGETSRRISWEEIARTDPDSLLVAPCGFDLERTESEWDEVKTRPEVAQLRAVQENRVLLADGNSFFSRPGPRLLDSMQLVADAVRSWREYASAKAQAT
jgi:iron complex transport system substrate-binding protein